jgi:multidrug efflux pump subunit AcrA (membrane-fusion protein)
MIRVLTIIFALLGVIGFFISVRLMNHPEPARVPVVEPVTSSFERSVGGTGLVEAHGENVNVAAIISGVVAHIPVQAGDKVRRGDVLFQTEAGVQKAAVATAEAELVSLKAGVEEALQMMNEKADLAARMDRLRARDVNSEEESVQADLQLASAKARYSRAIADLAHGEAQLVEARAEFERTFVRAPRDAQILRVNIREGEFAQPFSNDAAMVIGDTDRLQVRVDIDEDNASRIRPSARAMASTRGLSSVSIPLDFARIEPLVVPKESLSGERQERVDTRVLQVIYTFLPPQFPVHVGQVLDVSIEAPSAEPVAKSSSNGEARE